MRKSWFELTHYYYLPPHLPDEGGGFANGQMCLGHIVKDFKPFECSEEPINQSKEGIMFAPAVTINHTTWKEVEGKQSAPIGAGVSILAAHQTKFACGNPEENCKEGATFDRYTFEPDREFISRILEDEKVAAHIKRTKGVQLLGFGGRWSVYMVTGITVARDAKLRIEL
ncbi:uncharacterized protein TRIVIDRAFT_217664 [Trichoderma virens Gv29-8]|uniref:Uncharacterized protein n=1 Tax=Hypocrea virens (strain Gv29-8 / FGSC 10586) TaxID=413071 RepID=G9MF96_HYPVG|nr:uncharacterized protein TRIVIDRAFT_217664 [Trichoderma virens Gv29-8]EHK27062.1 hypothetical protein TRIVIDRAFT_217664 [Trichoderma virens Gv29-8]UKZ57517.1 hypothetical protein TrVGV298_011375 [Trichoderma virens]